jgi:ubiquinone/menaquinone biosynthesis C-methylase UbiE
LADLDLQVRSFYDGRAEAYDKFLHLTFVTHNEDEQTLRHQFIDALELGPTHKVLEVSCGTGRDSEIIAERLGGDGLLCLQDIAAGMLARCRQRLSAVAVPTSYSVSNACYLPYPDKYFDAVYSFGGLGEFSDIKRSLAEMVRVSKPGAKIVVGDESMPPWLRETEFAKILITTNKQFLARLPLEEMPVEARDVRLRWVIGGVFYLIDFRVGEGEPTGNFDFEIPGVRGGTYRSRYLGQLEGVKVETKQLAERARAKKGVSMHDWLDEVVRKAALKDLE